MLFNLSSKARPVRVVTTGDNPALIVNRDITNTVAYGDQSIASGNINSYGLIDPLGSISVDGTTDIWVIPLTGTATIDVVVGASNWSPSPAQIAAQLSTSGLALNSTLAGVNTTLGSPAQQVTPVVLEQLGSIGGAAAATIVPGTPFTAMNLVDVGLYQSYDINCYAFTTSPGAVNSNIVAQVVLQWFDDLTSNIPVFEEDWWIWCGRAAPVAGTNTLSGCGPMHGRYMTVQVFTTISAANNMTLQYMNIFGSSRPVPYSDWRQNGQAVNPQSNGITVSLGGGTGFDNILAGIFNLTLTASQLVFIPCGLYAGPVYYRFQCNTAAPLHNVVLCSMAGQVSGGLGAGTGTVGVLLNITADTNEHEGQLILPRAPTAFIIQGATAGTSSYSFLMAAQQAA